MSCSLFTVVSALEFLPQVQGPGPAGSLPHGVGGGLKPCWLPRIFPAVLSASAPSSQRRGEGGQRVLLGGEQGCGWGSLMASSVHGLSHQMLPWLPHDLLLLSSSSACSCSLGTCCVDRIPQQRTIVRSVFGLMPGEETLGTGVVQAEAFH